MAGLALWAASGRGCSGFRGSKLTLRPLGRTIPVMDTPWRERITVNPNVRNGQPTLRGMRITVKDVLGFLAAGMAIDDILREYPYLERADVYAALAYAAETVPDSVPA